MIYILGPLRQSAREYNSATWTLYGFSETKRGSFGDSILELSHKTVHPEELPNFVGKEIENVMLTKTMQDLTLMLLKTYRKE